MEPNVKRRTDRRLLRRRFLYLGLFLLTVLVAVTGYRLLGDIEKLRAAPRDNIQWTLSQAEVDLLLLSRAIRRAQTDQGSLSDLRKRFDLFYSRIDILAKGSAFKGLRGGSPGVDRLSELQAFLDRSVALIDGDDEALRDGLSALLMETDNLVTTVRDLSLKGVRLYAEASDAQRNTFTSTLEIAIYVSGGLIILLGVLLLFLERQSRISLERARDSDRARRRVSATVNGSLDAVVVANGDGMVIDWNDAATEVFGYSRERAIGQEMGELIVPESLREAHRSGMKRFLETGEKRVVDSGRLELTALRADGTEFPVEISIALAEQEDGPVFVSYLRDISARLAAERALTEARDDAMAADKAKSEFLAVMSHEMRTPLNGVLGVLDLLDGTELAPRQRKYVAAAVNSGEILLRHINDVLDVTRIEADRMVFDAQSVDLSALLKDAVDVTTPIAEANGNHITISDDLPEGYHSADAHRLRQILLNLLGNAAKFTEGGKIVAGLRRVDVTDGAHMIEFAINDSGPGIAPEDRDRVFDDFVTLDASYDRKTSGSGLGLAISRRIVEAMGGEIGVGTSILGGARFWFRLPLTPTEASVETAQDEPTVGEGHAKVLLVEDNPLNRLVVREVLSGAGHQVVEAEHGQAGVEAAQSQHFDLILMDVSMPVMDGVTATQTIRAGSGASRDVPIIGLTAHAMPEERSRFLEAGMQDCLIKPVRRAELLTMAGRFASGAPQVAEATEEAGDSAAVVDDDVIADLAVALPADKLAETLEKAMSELEVGTEQLHKLAAEQDHEEMARVAHRLAGSAAMVGGIAVQERLAEIERFAKSDDAASAKEALVGIEKMVHDLSRVLREFTTE